MSQIKIFGAIENSDKLVEPYDIHKSWNLVRNDFNQTNSLYLLHYGICPTSIPYVPTNIELKNWDNTLASTTYISIESLYKTLPELVYTNITLNKNIVIFSISKNSYGTSIKKGSVNIKYTDINSVLHELIDYNGYLLDLSISSSNFVDNSYLLCHYGFNEKFNYITSSIILDTSPYISNAKAFNLTYELGIRDNNLDSYGYSAVFNGIDSFVKIDNSDKFKLTKNSDFAISLWILPRTNSLTNNVSILSKRREGTLIGYNSLDNLISSTIDYNSSIYPYDIIYTTSSQLLECFRSDGFNNIYTSCSLNLNIYTHIIYQKSGSLIQLFKNGIKVSEAVDNLLGDVNNSADIFLGSNGISRNVMSGSLDEVRIYNKALTLNEIQSLYNFPTCMQTNIVGNVLYNNGMIIYNPFNTGSFISLQINNFNLTYKNTVNIRQHTYTCRVPADGFNTTLNSTMFDEFGNLNQTLISSSITPYITSVGLYNKNYELVAVAKLSTPIQKLPTADLNFVIKFDEWI